MSKSRSKSTKCPLDNRRFKCHIKFIAHVRKEHSQVPNIKTKKKKPVFYKNGLRFLEHIKDGRQYSVQELYKAFSPSLVTRQVNFLSEKHLIDRYQEVHERLVYYSINSEGLKYLENFKSQLIVTIDAH